MDELKKNIISIYHEQGQKWLESLPETLQKIAQKYQLSSLTPLDNMTFHYVATGYQNDAPVVLKIGLNPKVLAHEALCLRAFEKTMVPQVIAHDDHMIIMQCAMPGHTLREYFPDNDIEATKILCSIIKQIHTAPIPTKHHFLRLDELFRTLDNKLEIPDKILTTAKNLRDKLLSTTKNDVLLHGDLHHDNILRNLDSWMVIDPKGFIGDPAFELAAYLCNPISQLLKSSQPRTLIENRINLCHAELSIDVARIVDWLYAKSVLCWAWSLEDHGDVSYWLNLIRIITPLRDRGLSYVFYL